MKKALWRPRGAIVKFKNKNKSENKNTNDNENKNENKNENENKIENEKQNENENQNEFSFVFFHFIFHFRFCFLKVFCIFVNSTRPRGAIDGQLSLYWPRSAISFLLTPRGLEVL